MSKISQYPSKTVFNNTDLVDFSTDGGGSFTSEQATWLQVKNEIEAGLGFTSLTNAFQDYMIVDVVEFTGAPNSASATFTTPGNASNYTWTKFSSFGYLDIRIRLEINNAGSALQVGSYVEIDPQQMDLPISLSGQSSFPLCEHYFASNSQPLGRIQGTGDLSGLKMRLAPDGGIPAGITTYSFHAQTHFIAT